MGYSKKAKELNDNKVKLSALASLANTSNSGGFSGGISGVNNLEMHTGNVENMVLTSINSNYKVFSGSCFDGRYIYLVPLEAAQPYFIRYDTTQAFTTSNIDVVDLTNGGSNPSHSGFISAVFDGRYIYLIPSYNTAYHGIVMRYDTTLSFSIGNFTTYDLSTINANYKGFGSATFDGRYVYLPPDKNTTVAHGYFARYDTTKTFTASGSWDFYDITNVDVDCKGYLSSCICGNYIYLSPYYTGAPTNNYHGHAIRYDIAQSFTSSSSYDYIDLESNDSELRGFFHCCTDGDNVYYIPYYSESKTKAKILKYDTSKNFNEFDSFENTNLMLQSTDYSRFYSALIINKKLYLIPYEAPTTKIGKIVQYDTTEDFDYSNFYDFDLTTFSANYKGYFGACFDDQWLYLIPYYNTDGKHGNFLRIKIKA